MHARKTRSCISWLLLSAFLCCAIAAGGEEKPGLESTVAENAIYFMRFSGLDAINAPLSKTGYDKLYRDPRFRKFMDKPFAELKKRVDEMRKSVHEKSEGKLDVDPDEILKMLRGEMLLVVEAPQDGTYDSIGDLSAYFVAEVGDASDRVKALLDSVLQYKADDVEWREKMHNDISIIGIFPKNLADDASVAQRNPVNYALADGYLIAAQKMETLQRVIDSLHKAPEKRLIDTPAYLRFKKELPAQVHSLHFFDVQKLYASLPEPKKPEAVENLPEGMEMPPAPDYRDILRALGVADVASMGGWGVVEDDGTTRKGFFIYNPVEPEGLFKLFSQSNAQMDVPAFLPNSTAAYNSIRFSPGAFYDFIVKMLDSVNPGLGAIVEMRAALIKEQNGIDVRKELLTALGDEIGVVTIPPKADENLDFGNLNPFLAQIVLGKMTNNSFAFVFEVTDVPSCEAVLSVIIAQVGDSNPALGNVTTETIGELQIHQIGQQQEGMMPGIMPLPSYMFAKNRFFFALDAQILRDIAGQIASGKDGFADQPLLKSAMAKLENKPATALMCMNMGPYMEHQSRILQALMQIIQVTQQMQEAQGDDNQEGAANPMTMGMGMPGGMGNPLTFLLDILDLEAWPPHSIYKSYLGFSASRMYPLEDGMRISVVDIPNPDAPDPELVSADEAKPEQKTEAEKAAPAAPAEKADGNN